MALSCSFLTQSNSVPEKVIQVQEAPKESSPLASTGSETPKVLSSEDNSMAEAAVLPEPKPETVSQPDPAPKPVQPQVPHTALLPGENGYQWMDRMQKEYGVYAYPGTQFFVAPSTPCPQRAAVGCTEQWMNMDGTPTHTRIRLHMAEAYIGNVYVLFHEIGHTQGIMDECQADIYSRNITGIPGGFYCE